MYNSKFLIFFSFFITYLIITSYCYSQKKYTYVDKYKYVQEGDGDIGYVFSLNYTQYLNTASEYTFYALKYRTKYLNISGIGFSYCELNYNNLNTNFVSFHSSFGLCSPLITRKNFNIFASSNIMPRFFLWDTNESYEHYGEKFLLTGELFGTIKTSYISCDLGYMASKKNFIGNYNYNSNSTSINTPYHGFFLRININLGSKFVGWNPAGNNMRVYAGSKKIRLPSPRLIIDYKIDKKILEAGKKENLEISIINKGRGDADNAWLYVSTNPSGLITFKGNNYIGKISAKTKKVLEIPLEIHEDIYNKEKIQFSFNVKEKDGFKATKNIYLSSIPKKPIYPPQLKIIEQTLLFTDYNNNNVLEANENALVKFQLKNLGKGDAIGLKLITTVENCEFLSFEKVIFIGNMQSGEQKEVKFPLKSSYDSKSCVCKVSFFFEESNKFNSESVDIEFSSAKFEPPKIIVTDYLISTPSKKIPRIGEPINIQFSIQNIGQSTANDVNINCIVPDYIFFSTNKTFSISELKPNEYKIFDIEIFANKQYAEQSIPLTLDINESFGKYAQDRLISISLSDDNSTIKKIVEGQILYQDIKISGLRSDVDINIPKNNIVSQNVYALIIGNEDYSSKQNNNNKEVDVIFAINDAQVFSQYLQLTYGVPIDNINLILNGTATEIKQGINKLSQIASLVGEKSEFIIYYAGHGISDNIKKEPFILPVDVNASNLEYAISLSDFTKIFHNNSVKNSTIILDACFSGLSRNMSIIDTRAVRVRPKYSSIPKNTVILSASSEIEPSHPYYEQKHGLFSYYLLKGLQESNGIISLKELFQQLKENVELKSLLLHNQKQTPSIMYENDINNNLVERKLVE